MMVVWCRVCYIANVTGAVQGVLSDEEVPRTESLQDLVERTLPLWRKRLKTKKKGSKHIRGYNTEIPNQNK